MDADVDDLQKLSDPELMLRVTTARTSLVYTPPGKPGHAQATAGYDRLRDEYRRRIDTGREADGTAQA